MDMYGDCQKYWGLVRAAAVRQGGSCSCACRGPSANLPSRTGNSVPPRLHDSRGSSPYTCAIPQHSMEIENAGPRTCTCQLQSTATDKNPTRDAHPSSSHLELEPTTWQLAWRIQTGARRAVLCLYVSLGYICVSVSVSVWGVWGVWVCEWWINLQQDEEICSRMKKSAAR